MTSPPVVNVSWLENNRDKVKTVAVRSDVPPKLEWKEFREKYYGKFEELIQKDAKNLPNELIPGSVYFDLAVAYYPGEFQRFSLYPPELFKDYVRLLGIDDSDHVVLYSQGPAIAMRFAARAWWTFKLYGHQNVSVLNGGLDAWKSAGLPVDSSIAHSKRGNWTGAGSLDHTLLATFEELDERDTEGKSLFEKLDTINYLDARPREQFAGEQPLSVPAPEATGTHIRQAKNLPYVDIMTPNGLKSSEEIKQALERAGFDPTLPTVTTCIMGIQASLLSLGLASAGYKSKMFNGSMTEVGARAPKYINGKK